MTEGSVQVSRQDCDWEDSTIYKNTNPLKHFYISISFKHKSPEFAHYFLSLIIKEANSLLREVDLQESSEALNYLNDQLVKTQQSDIRNSINQLIKSKLETQMLANVNKDYVLRPLDKPYLSLIHISEPTRPY